MQIDLRPGKYVVAVSGGVDSMVLLNVLSKQPGLQLVVAHFEHGIRSDSDEDRVLVEREAKRLGLPFVCEHGKLGAGASEAAAREARYGFLRTVQKTNGARAIITAHHQDDLIETAILNMLRGTGRKGLSALADSHDIIRPLLHIPKAEILSYALAHHIVWREDSTNADDAYLRNYIRHTVMPKLGDQGRAQLLAYIDKAQDANPQIDRLLAIDIAAHEHTDGLERHWFIMLPYDVSCEAVAAWLRQQGVRDFDRSTIERLVVQAKVGQPGKQYNVLAGRFLKVAKTRLQLTP
ncbi:MAG TPA: tRNA lysidine(34) synthetase TilS [Candidatus Saccharimonadales bacterium]